MALLFELIFGRLRCTREVSKGHAPTRVAIDRAGVAYFLVGKFFLVPDSVDQLTGFSTKNCPKI
jgi:hypothetical protein